jgi:aminoglycoside phosphotransferase (APT) family kinase protein
VDGTAGTLESRSVCGASAQTLAEAVAAIADAVPAQREVTLVHGDFHLRNVIVAASAGRGRAVLDWELCTLGEPLADVGGLLGYCPHVGEPGR